MRGEFGDELGLGLGDLPEDITAERQRVAGLSRQMRNRPSSREDSIADIKYQDVKARTPKEAGVIPFSGEVISTYDSRPINAVDFSSTNLETFTLTAVAGDATTVTATYTVPGGYVGVLRGYRFEMTPVVPISAGGLVMDIFVNGVSMLGYRSLIHGQILNDFVPCFVLANGGEEIEIKIRAPAGINSVIPDVRQVLIEMHGNLLQTTGAPLQLEIANKEVGLPVKTSIEKRAPTMARQSMQRNRFRQLFRRFRFF